MRRRRSVRFDRATRGRLIRWAGEPSLLVVSDFDGTLAPIVDRPADARALPRAALALADLSRLPGTHAAIVSGRDLSTLADLWTESGSAMAAIEFRGTYGSQTSRTPITAEQRHLLDELAAALTFIASGVPGAFVERKACSVALHTRLREARGEKTRARRDVARARASARSIIGTMRRAGADLREHRGADVIEWSALPGGKADAVREMIDRLEPACVVMLGDDRSDVAATASLRNGDAVILVGANASRIWRDESSIRPGIDVVHAADPFEAARVLGALARLRRRARRDAA